MEDYAIVSYYENHMTWCHECIKIHSKGKQTKTKQRTSEQEKTVALFLPNISAIVFFHFPLVSLRRRQYKLDRAEKVNSFKIYLRCD